MALFMAQNHAQSSLNITDESMEISSDAGHYPNEDDTLIDIDIDVDAPLADAPDERMEDDLEENPDDLMDDEDRDDATNEEIMDDYHVEDEEEDVELEDLPNEDVAFDSHDVVDFRNSDHITNPLVEADPNNLSLLENNELDNTTLPRPVHSDNAEAADNVVGPLARDLPEPQNESDDLHDDEERVVNEEIKVVEEDVRYDNQDSNDQEEFDVDGQSRAAPETSGQARESQTSCDGQADPVDLETPPLTDIAAADDGISLPGPEVSRPSKAPPLKVIWEGYEFDPFAPDDGLAPFQDLDIAEKPLPDFIGALKTMLRDQIEEEFELEIEFRQLNLSLRENTPDSSCSLVDVNEIYVSLCNNDGNFEQAPLEIALFSRAPFALRYRQLHEAHSSGQGLNTLLPDSDSDNQTEYYGEAESGLSYDEAVEATELEGKSLANHDGRRPSPARIIDHTEGTHEVTKSVGLTDLAVGEAEDVNSVSQIQDFADEVHEAGKESKTPEQGNYPGESEELITSKGADERKEEEEEEEQDFIDYSDEELTAHQAQAEGTEEDYQGVDDREQESVPGHGQYEVNEVGGAVNHEADDVTQQDEPDGEGHVYDDRSEIAYETPTEQQFNHNQTDAEPRNDADYAATDAYTEEYEPQEATEYYDAPVDVEENIDNEAEDADAEAKHAEHDDDDSVPPHTVSVEAERASQDRAEGNLEDSIAAETLDDIGDESMTAKTIFVPTKLGQSSNANLSTLSRKRSFSQREADGESNVTNDQKKSRAS